MFQTLLGQKNNEALATAQNMEYNSLQQVAQGASVLAGIADSISKDQSSSKTLDLEGRDSTVDLMRVRSHYISLA